MTAAVAACSVNHQGLTNAPDAAADALVEMAPAVDVGSDVMCPPCDSVATFVTLPGGRFTGTTGGSGGSASVNQGTCGGGDAPEALYKLDLPVKSDLFVTTHGTGFNTVLYLRSGSCCGAEIACNDDADGRATSVLAQRGLEAGTYYIYVDGATSADAGPFTIDIYAMPSSANPAETCGTPLPIAAGATPGNTCGFQDDYSPPASCSSAAGANGLDQVYYFVLDQKTDVTFSTCDSTCIDTVLYVRDVCSRAGGQSGPSLCDDDSCRATGSCQPQGNAVQSNLTTSLAAGVHYLFLDTFAAAQMPCGDFTITATGIP